MGWVEDVFHVFSVYIMHFNLLLNAVLLIFYFIKVKKRTKWEIVLAVLFSVPGMLYYISAIGFYISLAIGHKIGG